MTYETMQVMIPLDEIYSLVEVPRVTLCAPYAFRVCILVGQSNGARVWVWGEPLLIRSGVLMAFYRKWQRQLTLKVCYKVDW